MVDIDWSAIQRILGSRDDSLDRLRQTLVEKEKMIAELSRALCEAREQAEASHVRAAELDEAIEMLRKELNRVTSERLRRSAKGD
jgi:hypothetical protein